MTMKGTHRFLMGLAFGTGLLLLPGRAAAQATGLDVEKLEVGQKAPNFAMKQMGKADYAFSRDYFGELRTEAKLKGLSPRTVVLSFFASWCHPCGEEMPVLTRIAKENAGKDLQVFFVNLGEEDATVQAWLQKHPEISGTVLMDPYAQTTKVYGVDALPRTIIIDPAGTVRYIERGFETEGYYTEISEALKKVLSGGGPSGD
jgi:thiol-disulfide isomerase/thioredoxin